MTPTPAASSHPLTQLEQQLARELDYLCLPEANWMPEHHYKGQMLLDVAIIGAGMAGATAAAALNFIGVSNTQLFDAAPEGHEGPWATHARMLTLRSGKHLTGPALGVPSLTFRAWYTAQHGETGWHALQRIPTLVWHDYLCWYKKALQLSSHNKWQLLQLHSHYHKALQQPIAVLCFATPTGKQTVYARHVVFATGMDGLGGPNIPAIAHDVTKRLWAHSSEYIDFTQLKNKEIAIVGGGDSALDAAATALDAGAARADVYLRSSQLSQINYWKAYVHSGHRYGYAHLHTQQRQQLFNFLMQHATPPANGTVERVLTHPNLHLHFDHPISALTSQGDACLLQGPHQQHKADFVVFATGYKAEVTLRPELQEVLPHLQRIENTELGAALNYAGVPVLHNDFSFSGDETAYPLLAKLHCFTSQALTSVGKICGDIPGISVGAQQLSQGIAAKLYQAEFNWQLQSIKAYDELEVSDATLASLYRKSNEAE